MLSLRSLAETKQFYFHNPQPSLHLCLDSLIHHYSRPQDIATDNEPQPETKTEHQGVQAIFSLRVSEITT
jgi:hypothetical protein